jgi:HSP20 family protein
MQQHLEDISERFFGDVGSSGMANVVFAPPFDVIDCANEVLLRADLPGLEQKDIQIEVQDGTLVLRGERKDEHQEHNDNYRLSERWEGSFMRTLPLPPGIDLAKIQAKFNNGVLEVHMPKKPEAAPRKIEVKKA